MNKPGKEIPEGMSYAGAAAERNTRNVISLKMKKRPGRPLPATVRPEAHNKLSSAYRISENLKMPAARLPCVC